MSKLNGVFVAGIGALLVYWAWPTVKVLAIKIPVTQTGFPNTRLTLSNTQAMSADTKGAAGGYSNGNPFGSGSPTIGPLLPNSQMRNDLRTREGRQDFSDDMAKRKPGDIWANWDDAVSRGDSDELGIVIPAMGIALRREGTKDLYSEMAKRLYQSDLGVQERLYVIGAFQHAATPEAVQLLLEYSIAVEEGRVANGDTAATQQILLKGTQQSVRLASRELIDGSRNWPISAELANAWLKLGSADALNTRLTISEAIVYLAKPDGLSVLIESVNQSGLTSDARNIALAQIAQLSSNDSVPVLGNRLNNITPVSTPIKPDVTEALIGGLVSVGSADSIKAIAIYLNQPTLSQKSRDSILTTLRERNLPDEALKIITDYRKK